jgi:hypothetical protein
MHVGVLFCFSIGIKNPLKKAIELKIAIQFASETVINYGINVYRIVVEGVYLLTGQEGQLAQNSHPCIVDKTGYRGYCVQWQMKEL